MEIYQIYAGLFFSVFSFCEYYVLCGEAPFLGLHESDLHRYNPTIDFTCKDGSLSIPFELVNDDYCDCTDGSDEPSTSACANGRFYCANLEHIDRYVHSSRINDGVCDCCDGSDEYISKSCPNICKEEQLRLEKEAEEQALAEELRSRYINTARRHQLEHAERSQLKIEMDDLEEELANNIAKDQTDDENHFNEDNDTGDTYESYEDGYIRGAFSELDSNKNGVLELIEVKSEKTFDLNKNARVEDDEIKWYYDVMPSVVDVSVFKSKVWKRIGRLYVLEKELDKSLTFQHSWSDSSDKKKEKHKFKDSARERRAYEEEEWPSQNDWEDRKYDESNIVDDFENLGDVDEDTRKIVEDAKTLRKRMEENRKKMDKIKRSVEAENSWAKYKREETDDTDEDDDVEYNSQYEGKEHLCAHYIDKIHIYTVCPFHNIFQRDKYDTKRRVRIGRWVGWQSKDERPLMMYENGDLCPNGRFRSAIVKVYCGTKNLVVHVEEPQLCEYVFDLKTPAGCHLDHMTKAGRAFMPHDEL